MEFNLPVRAAKYALVAEAFGVKDDSADDETNARAAIKAVAELSISVCTAMSIEQMGGTPEIIAEAVKQAITDLCILSNARPATSADILGMYEAAMSDPVLYPVEAAVASARL
jgi:alcohol dehydrogenase